MMELMDLYLMPEYQILFYPSKMITNGRTLSKKMTAFNFYGPTCDSLDYMKGPFLLPNNIKEGDYIELGQLGAYGTTFRTKFNGFYSDAIYQLMTSQFFPCTMME